MKMASSCDENFEIRVGNLPYSEDLTYNDYHFKRGLFSKACISGRWPWKLEKRYIEDLEECLSNALYEKEILVSNNLLPDWFKVHKIGNPLTYENPKDATELNVSYGSNLFDLFRPYAYVKCSKYIFDLLLKAGEDEIMFKDQILRLTVSKGIRSDNFEIFVGNLPYSEDLTYDDYQLKRGLFSKACISGRRPWKLEKRYIEKLETHLTGFLYSAMCEPQFGYELDRSEPSVKVHKIVNPLTYEDPKEATESNHFRPYAFVKCTDGPEGRLLLKIVELYGITLEGSNLRLAISKGVPSDLPNHISDDIITNSKKKKSVSLHPLAIASSYLDDINWHVIRTSFIDVPKLNGTEHRKFEDQTEFDDKIVNAQGMYFRGYKIFQTSRYCEGYSF